MERTVDRLQNNTPSTLTDQRSGGFYSNEKKQHTEGDDENNHLFFDAALHAVARASGASAATIASKNLAQLLEKLVGAVPLIHTDSDVGVRDGCTFDVESLIRNAVVDTLAWYNELIVSPEVAKGTMSSSSLLSEFVVHRASVANLRSLSTLLSHRPHFSLPVLASLFQLTVVVVKHASLEALDEEGCRVLVCLLELLGCLPRGSTTSGMPDILRVARITARNVLRRLGPRLFQKAVPVGSEPGCNTLGVAAMAHEEVEKSLISWVERHLLPLHVVSGKEAQADLKEDRRLALLVLGFMFSDKVEHLEASRRITLHCLSDAVASILSAENGGADGHERQQALAFLEQVDIALSSTPVAPRERDFKDIDDQSFVSEEVIQGFLHGKEEAYRKEFAKLQRHIDDERCNQAILRRQLDDFSQEREEIRRELTQSLLQSLPSSEMASLLPSSVAIKEGVGEETFEDADSLPETWAHNMLSLLQPVEERAVVLQEEEQRWRAVSLNSYRVPKGLRTDSSTELTE